MAWLAERMERELAIRLRGVVKSYGPITAVSADSDRFRGRTIVIGRSNLGPPLSEA